MMVRSLNGLFLASPIPIRGTDFQTGKVLGLLGTFPEIACLGAR